MTNRSTKRSYFLREIMTAGSLLAIAAPAFAQERVEPTAPTVAAADDTPADGEVVVTARRRNERLQDVPIAISVIGGSELSAKHLERVADLAIKVPISAPCNRIPAYPACIFAVLAATPATTAQKAVSG